MVIFPFVKEDGAGRCPFCVAAYMDLREFYDGKAWRSKRAKILRRDGYMCQHCKRYGRRREATEVHHIKHLDEFPELALVDSNLISLCHACHNRQHPEKGGARRYARQAAKNEKK